MNKKTTGWSILALTLNLVVALGGIAVLLVLLKEGVRTYHVLLCIALVICGGINCIRIAVMLRDKGKE